jgi:FtsP/CotA-like multicopper oxidase with cupredoxin domain
MLGSRSKLGYGRRLGAVATLLVFAAVAWLIFGRADVRATSGGDPYSAPDVVDTNPDPHITETTLTAQRANVDVGGGVIAHAETLNGAIPGPTFHLHVGDTVIVHFVNHLSAPTAIHWHGIELDNVMDGTPYTQNQVQPNGTFLYKFKVDRPGIYWYHPHHDFSTNQVFAGQYGMIVVTDPNEAALQASGALPPASQTKPLVLSDVTVCKAPGTNDTQTYPLTLPWVGGGALPAQASPVPKDLCETPNAVDVQGNLKPTSYAAGDIPAIQQNGKGRENEGQTVLTNGKNVGGRLGSPAAPGALASGASTLDVRPGQGLRLELVNASAIRFMRLHLTSPSGVDIPLVRVGGEGGLLDAAVVEGNTQPVPVNTFDTGYFKGEILLPPGSRADVVAAIPSLPASGVMTLWTEDYSRTGLGFSDIPTVPVMHLNLTGSPLSPAYSIVEGTPLRAATGDLVPALGPTSDTLLNPATFSPAKLGNASPGITFDIVGNKLGVNGTVGDHSAPNYETAPHLVNSSRYAKVGDTLELTTTNNTGADHPFHLHGFSIQPLDLTKSGSPTYTWPYHEFRDNVDIPPGYTLRFRLKITDRPLADGVTPGGALGRWVFHCHIFFHATLGMISELVVLPANGKERPDINVDQTNVQVNQGQTATATGSYFDIGNQKVTLSSSVGTMTDNGGGKFTWKFPSGSATSQFVYLTATNPDGSKGQIPFFLSVVNPPPTLALPVSAKGTVAQTLKFGTGATDPNPLDKLKLGATGLPSGLTFTDNHNRAGTVAGIVRGKSGKFTATFSVSDGHNATVRKTIKITISPAQLLPNVGRRVRLSNGRISIGCRAVQGAIRKCSVTVQLGGKRVGAGSAHFRTRGKRSITVSIKLNSSTVKKIKHARHGVQITLHLVATKFGTKGSVKADAQTTAVKH